MTESAIIKKDKYLNEKYYGYKHKSGLDIYYFPKSKITSSAVLGVKYGAADNGYLNICGEKIKNYPDGIAHFLEHKMFANEDGTDSFEVFSKYGTDSNAYTSYDSTAYIFSGSVNFSRCLKELVSFVTRPYFTADSVAKEVGIISEEIKMYHDSAHERCHNAMLSNMYLQKGIKTDIAGSLESICEITHEMLYDCHKTFYHPSNLVLVVCGKVNFETIIRICDEILPISEDHPGFVRENPNKTEPQGVLCTEIEQKMQVSRPLFSIGIKDTDIPETAAGRLHRHLCVSLINQIIFSGSGELFEILFEKGLVSDPLSYSYSISESYAYASVSGETDDPNAVFELIKNYIAEVCKKGITEPDLTVARKISLSNFVKNFDSPENIANLMFSYLLDGIELFDTAEVLKSITLFDINCILKTFFKENKITISIINPII